MDISLNNLRDDGLDRMAEALKQNTQLKELWICCCGMTDKGAASLASALSVNNSLKMLHMDGGRALSTIAKSLENSSEIVKLVIFQSDSSDIHLSRKLNEAGKHNRLLPIKTEGEWDVCLYR